MDVVRLNKPDDSPPPPAEQQTVVLLPRSPTASKTYFPIPVDHLEDEYRLRSADDGKLFREEYNVSIPACCKGVKIGHVGFGVQTSSLAELRLCL